MNTTYIVQSGDRFKIGSSRNWAQRRDALARDNSDLRDVLVLECANYETALRNERLLQAVFFEHNVNYRADGKWRRSDWFNNLPFANDTALLRQAGKGEA